MLTPLQCIILLEYLFGIFYHYRVFDFERNSFSAYKFESFYFRMDMHIFFSEFPLCVSIRGKSMFAIQREIHDKRHTPSFGRVYPIVLYS